jgi:hypothetical protein
MNVIFLKIQGDTYISTTLPTLMFDKSQNFQQGNSPIIDYDQLTKT